MKNAMCLIAAIYSVSLFAVDAKPAPATKRKPAQSRASVATPDSDCEAFANKEIQKAIQASFAKATPKISGEVGFSIEDINSAGWNSKRERSIQFTTSQFMMDEGYLSGSSATAVVHQDAKGVCALAKPVDVRLGRN